MVRPGREPARKQLAPSPAKRQSTFSRPLTTGAFAALTLLGLAACGASPARADEVPPLRINRLAGDASGTIWGIGGAGQSALYRWKDRQWKREAFEPGDNASPEKMVRSGDGTVLCLWRVGKYDNHEQLLSRHNGSSSGVLARWRKDTEGPVQLFQGTHDIWFTARGRDIYRVQGGGLQLAYQLKRNQMISGRAADDTNEDASNELDVLQDSLGRTIFWSNEHSVGFDTLSLRGLLIYQNGKWTHHPRLPGVPDKPYTALVQRDARTFWLAVGDNGLYEVDAATLRGKRVADPLRRAFEGVQKIEKVSGIWYLVADAAERNGHEGEVSIRDGDLWRWEAAPSAPRGKHPAPGGGTWVRIMRGLDWGGSFTDRPDRPLVKTAEGLWVGAVAGGAWLLPHDPKKKPVHIDWRRGFNLPIVYQLLPRRDGSLFTGGGWLGTVPNLRPYAHNAAVAQPAITTCYSQMMQDQWHRIWRVPSLSRKALQMWDGVRWTSHPVPAGYPLTGLSYLVADHRGRIWLQPDYLDGKTAIFDPRTGAWLVFPSYPAALQNQLKVLGGAEFAKLKTGYEKYLAPKFKAPNRIAFRSNSEKLYYFDGRNWRKWTLRQITGTKTETWDWEETPFWNSEGTLCTTIGDKTWQLGAAGKWHATNYESEEDDGTPSLQPPQGSGIRNPSSIVRDSDGAVWMVKDRQLYKAAWGLCAPQFTPGRRHPLSDGQGLSHVLLDARGNTVLAKGTEFEEEYFFLPRAPLDTKLRLVQDGADTFTAHLEARSQKGPHWFRWRLDGGAWSEPRPDPRIPLNFLPAGTHRLEAAAIDARLQVDATPAFQSFQVKVATRAQLDRLLNLLRSTDYAQREAAVVALARQPGHALPMLRAARPTADADTAWWIDAAIEEIESKPITASTAPGPPSPGT